jgi:hypothetical protein
MASIAHHAFSIRPMLLAVALLAVAMPPARAQDAGIEVSYGRSYTLRHHWTDVAFVEWSGTSRPLWRLQWAPALGLGRFQARDSRLGNRLDRTVWVGAAGARAYLWRGAFFGFQLAATGGRTDALSTPYEFVSSLGWQGRHWVLMVRHISNGDLHKPNHGETMLLAGIRF